MFSLFFLFVWCFVCLFLVLFGYVLLVLDCFFCFFTSFVSGVEVSFSHFLTVEKQIEIS